MTNHFQTASELEQHINHVLPHWFNVTVKYDTNLGESMTILAYDTRQVGTKVTFHNSDTVIHLIMHFPSFGTWCWDKLGSTHGVKYRKLSAKTRTQAIQRVYKWFEKIGQELKNA